MFVVPNWNVVQVEIAVGEEQAIQVNCTPATWGPQTAVVTFALNTAENSTYAVEVTCTGQAEVRPCWPICR